MTATTEAPVAPAAAAALAETPKDREGDGQGRRSWWGLAFASPHVIGLALFTVVPIVASLVISFNNWPLLGAHSFVGFGNYVQLLQDPIFRTVILNTFLFTILYVPLNLVVSLGLAAWLTPKIRHRHVFRVLFFIPTVTPIVANVVVWRMLYQPSGAIDATVQTLFGFHAPNFLADANWAMIAVVMMSVWQGFGYNMLIFSAALDSVPENLVEAAELDGAGAWTTFWRVKFPLISPSVFFATMMTLITSFQVFVQPFILTKGGPGSATTTLVQFIYNQGFQYQQLGLASAGAWVLFVIILGITAVQFIGQRKWVHYE